MNHRLLDTISYEPHTIRHQKSAKSIQYVRKIELDLNIKSTNKFLVCFSVNLPYFQNNL